MNDRPNPGMVRTALFKERGRPAHPRTRDVLTTSRSSPVPHPLCHADGSPARLRRLQKPILRLASCVLPSCVPPTALRAKFTAYELPADFVADLRADRDALTACNSSKHSDNQEGVEATAAIDALLAQAQSVITRLDAAVKNRYARDHEKLAAWKSASHTVKPEKRLQPPVKPTPPTA